MDTQYWLNRWKTGNIGFNEPHPHRFLIKYFHFLNSSLKSKILVPLCGKSIDMIWLMQNKQTVIGVEVSDIAINQFFIENHIDYVCLRNNDLKIYKHKFGVIYNEDLFKLNAKNISDISLVYDRGCLTALRPQTIAPKYINWVKENTCSKIKILLIVFEHNNVNATEPPFHTDSTQLMEFFKVTLLEREHISQVKPHWVERGVQNLFECVYLIERIPS
jgi:thiopurine S-methyltransferase